MSILRLSFWGDYRKRVILFKEDTIREREMIKLNVGSGRNRLPGYENVDLFHPSADTVAPAWNLPYGSETIAEIYCSHMMEHLYGEELEKTLKEFSRVLMPLGTLEIITPDLIKQVDYFLSGGYDAKIHALNRIFGHQRKDGDTHYTGFWKERWERLLPMYGFKIIKIRNQPSRFNVPNRHIQDTDLYVRAQKR